MNASPVRRLAAYHLSALTLERPPFLSLALALGLLLIHAAGMLLVVQVARIPLWIVPLIVLPIAVAQFLPRVGRVLTPALLAPMWFVYLYVGVRFVWQRLLGGEIPGYFEYAPPDLRVALHFHFFLAAAILYSGLILLTMVFGSRGRGIVAAALLGSGLILGWAAVEYFGHRTAGATGSDPYAYVQMGIDLATRGTLSHPFPLFALVLDSPVSWYPIVHVGYRLPYDIAGNAITVWSPGGAAAFAVAYRAVGESGLYLVNPLFSLLSVLVSGLLAWELAYRQSSTRRLVIALVTGVLVATSNEIVDWAGVTMVDTQALVLSVLAFYFAIKVFRTGKWGWAVAAGIAWAGAYFVRHTQLVIVLGMLPLFLANAFPVRKRVMNLALMGATAFAIAVFDLWYHQAYLGNWLTPESEELALFSLGAIPRTLGTMGAAAFIGSEFGWLPLWVVAGVVLFTRAERVLSVSFLLWLSAALAIHLPYAALRLRDLIPEFPILAFYVGFGTAAGIAGLWAKRSNWAKVAAAALLFLILQGMVQRVWNTMPRVLAEPDARFGAMTAMQRTSFENLGDITPPNALIGASLNSGAVELYAKRYAFRPADWTDEEIHDFLEIAAGRGYAVYLLQDDASLDRILNGLGNLYRVERAATLDVPLFGEEEVPNAGTLWKVSGDGF